LDAAGREFSVADVAASFQEAIVDVQVDKTMAAAAAHDIDTVVLAGGVAANSRLRDRMAAAATDAGARVLAPHVQLCTDTGAMVAAAGANLLGAGIVSDLGLAAAPNMALADVSVSGAD